MRRLALTTVIAVALTAPSTASAGFYAAAPIDGPGAIKQVSDVDLARDGRGAVAYIRNDGGVDHVYVSRLSAGAFQPPERMDPGIEAGSSQAVVAAGEGGRIAVLFSAGGQVFANVKVNEAAGWTGPQLLGLGTSPAVDLTLFGVGFAVWVQGGDIRAASMPRRAASFSVVGGALDIDPANTAGADTGAPRIAASASGSALAVWGENFADGKRHLVSRRILEGALSTAPRDIWLGSLEGRPGIDADLPSVVIEDDASFAYVAFRQSFDDGGVVRQRAVARRLRGSTYDVPVTFDAGWGNGGITNPRIAMEGRGEGLFSSGNGATVWVSIMKDGRPRTPQLLGGGGMLPQAIPTIAQEDDRVITYFEAGNVLGRHYDDQSNRRQVPGAGQPLPLGGAGLGGVDGLAGLDADVDRLGNAVVAFVHDAGGARRVVAAVHDLPPKESRGLIGTAWKNSVKPVLRWEPAEEQWGQITYEVQIDGATVGTVVNVNEFAVPAKLSYGSHKFRVIATDIRGQKTMSGIERLGIDTAGPRIKVNVGGSGRNARVSVDARDRPQKKKPGSGVGQIKVEWGDGSRSFGATTGHRYRAGRKHTIKVTVTDRAGNRSITRKGFGG